MTEKGSPHNLLRRQRIIWLFPFTLHTCVPSTYNQSVNSSFFSLWGHNLFGQWAAHARNCNLHFAPRRNTMSVTRWSYTTWAQSLRQEKCFQPFISSPGLTHCPGPWKNSPAKQFISCMASPLLLLNHSSSSVTPVELHLVHFSHQNVQYKKMNS